MCWVLYGYHVVTIAIEENAHFMTMNMPYDTLLQRLENPVRDEVIHSIVEYVNGDHGAAHIENIAETAKRWLSRAA